MESSDLKVAPAAWCLPSNEGQSRREATRGERLVSIPCPKFLGGATVGGDKPEVGVPQLAAHGTGRGVDGRCGRPLGLAGPTLGTLGQNLRRAKRLNPGALFSGGRFRLDLRHQRGDLLLPLLRRQVLPAGKRIESQSFAARILEAAEIFPAAAGEVLLSAVEPPALQSLPLDQSLDAVDARPVLETFDKPFLTTMGKQLRLHVVKIWPV